MARHKTQLILPWINEYFNNAKAKILPLKSGLDCLRLLTGDDVKNGTKYRSKGHRFGGAND